MSAVLDQFINGTYGREWSSDPSTKEDWSLFIQNLLVNAATWVFPIQRLDIVNEPRLKNILAFATKVPSINFATSAVIARNLRPYLKRFRHYNVHRYYDLYPSDPSKHPSDLSNLENFDRWVESLQGHIPEGPRPNIDDSRWPLGGIQTLYIATLGERPLPDSQ